MIEVFFCECVLCVCIVELNVEMLDCQEELVNFIDLILNICCCSLGEELVIVVYELMYDDDEVVVIEVMVGIDYVSVFVFSESQWLLWYFVCVCDLDVCEQLKCIGGVWRVV